MRPLLQLKPLITKKSKWAQQRQPQLPATFLRAPLPPIKLRKLKQLPFLPVSYRRIEEFSVLRASNKLLRTDSTRKLKTIWNRTKWASTCKTQSKSFWREEMKSHLTSSTNTSTQPCEESTSCCENMHSSLPLSSIGNRSCNRWKKSSIRLHITKLSPPSTITRWSVSCAQIFRGIW